ncbi:MAG TPA: hypothetical protein VFV10_13890 [Gammaproteobacteria bacterium]|nr:hypothetical protein [Gammaproteobacteria bacterium]
MRDLTKRELLAVSGGELTEAQAAALTVGLMAMCTTPLVVAVGGIALLYYAWC